MIDKRGRKVKEVQALRALESIIGADHGETLMSMADLAVIYTRLDRSNEAVELRAKVLKARERVLGAQHRNTLMSMANLAVTYRA